MATNSRGSSAACPAAPSCETIFPRRRLRSMRPVRSQIARTLSSPPARFSTQSDTNADWSRSIGLILGALGRDSIRFSAVPAPSSSSISIGCCSINSEANSSGAPLRRFKHFCQKCLNHQSFYSFIPVLLIHGNSSCRGVFRNQLQGRLAENHRLIAFDLPGHGQSSNAPDPTRSYTRPGFADAAVELLEKLGVTEAIVIGWSLGGHIGIEMVPRFPGMRGVSIIVRPPDG